MAEVTFAHLLEEQKKTNELLAKQRNPLDGRTGAGRALLESQRETTSAVREGDKQTAGDYIKQSAIEVFAEYDTFRREKKFKTDPKNKSQDDDQFEKSRKQIKGNVIPLHKKSLDVQESQLTELVSIAKNMGLVVKMNKESIERMKEQVQALAPTKSDGVPNALQLEDKRGFFSKYLSRERGMFQSKIKDPISSGFSGLKGAAMSKFSKGLTAIGGFAKNFTLIGAGISVLKTLPGIFKAGFNLTTKLVKGVASIGKTVFGVVRGIAGSVLSLVGSIGNVLLAPFKKVGGILFSVLKFLGFAGLAFFAMKNFQTIRNVIVGLAEYFDSGKFPQDASKVLDIIKNVYGTIVSIATAIKDYFLDLNKRAEESLGFGFSDAIANMKEGDYLDAGKQILSLVGTMIGKGFMDVINSDEFRKIVHNALNAILTPIYNAVSKIVPFMDEAGPEGILGGFQNREQKEIQALISRRQEKFKEDLKTRSGFGTSPIIDYETGMRESDIPAYMKLSTITRQDLENIRQKIAEDNRASGVFNITDNSGNGGTTVNMNGGERVDDAVYVGSGRNKRRL